MSIEQKSTALWGEVRYDAEAKQVALGTTTGYLIQHNGIWLLDWTDGTAGLTLHAPGSALSEAMLMQLAAQVEIQSP